MMRIKKRIVVPVDGSRTALKSLDYLDLIYGPDHELEVNLFYVLPSLPPILTEEKNKDMEVWSKLAIVEKRNKNMAGRILADAKAVLVKKGFNEERIKMQYHKRQASAAKDNRYIRIDLLKVAGNVYRCIYCWSHCRQANDISIACQCYYRVWLEFQGISFNNSYRVALFFQYSRQQSQPHWRLRVRGILIGIN